jgi:hypothetical protein
MTFAEAVPKRALSRCAILITITCVVYLIFTGVRLHAFYQNDADGVGVLLQIIGTLYSVLYAFTTYVIWGQYTQVENQILKEAGSLKDLALFSSRLKESVREPIVRAVKLYARAVVGTEWMALSQDQSTEKTDRLFLNVISSVAEIKVEDANESAIYERLLAIANDASSHRDERIAISVKRIPRTLLVFVTVTALTILFLLLLYPFHSVVLGLAAIVITTALLYFAHFVVTDLDNPFEGLWNVSAAPFGELITNLR